MRVRLLFPLILALLLLMTFSSCKKSTDPPGPDPIQVSDQAVLSILGEALQYSSAGLVFELKELTSLADELFERVLSADSCGTRFDESLYSDPNPTSSFIGYSGNRTWQAYCNETYEARSVTAHTHIEPFYSPVFMAVVSEGTWSLHPAAGNAVDFSGSYQRWGHFNRESLSSYLYTLEIRPSFLTTRVPFSVQTLMARFTLTFEMKIGQDIVKKVIPGTLEFQENGKIDVDINEKNYEIFLEKID